MVNLIPFGKGFILYHLFDSPTNHFHRLRFLSVFGLLGKANLMGIGVINPHVSITTGVVWSREKGNEQRLILVTMAYFVGIMSTFPIIDREHCSTCLKKPFISYFVSHCENSIVYNL